jgi:hypothetical protein
MSGSDRQRQGPDQLLILDFMPSFYKFTWPMMDDALGTAETGLQARPGVRYAAPKNENVRLLPFALESIVADGHRLESIVADEELVSDHQRYYSLPRGTLLNKTVTAAKSPAACLYASGLAILAGCSRFPHVEFLES